MPWSLYAVAAVVGYLLGSVPVGYVVGRMHGIDIREHGSGNIGATNVLRVLGKKPGIFVFACDALKGVSAVLYGKFVATLASPPTAEAVTASAGMDGAGTAQPIGDAISAAINHHGVLLAITAAVACILGHNFPVWLRFKGGKGIATTAGVLLGLMPLALAVAGLVWAAAYFTLRYVSVASLLAAAMLPVVVGMLWRTGRADAALFYFSVAAAALAWWRHRTNIQRLLAGTEPRFTKKVKPPAATEPPSPAA